MIFDNEQWIQIKDYPRYYISNYGRVKSCVNKQEYILKPNIIKGYEYVKLYKIDDNKELKIKLISIHRMVAQHFCDNFSVEKEVHHIDLNSRNNKAENLICLSKEEHRETHKKITKKNEECEKEN